MRTDKPAKQLNMCFTWGP